MASSTEPSTAPSPQPHTQDASTVQEITIKVDPEKIEQAVLRLFDFLGPWMRTPILYAPSWFPIERSLTRQYTGHRDIPEVRDFVLQVQYETCHLVETIGWLREAAEKGFAAAGEGLYICRQYKGLPESKDIVAFTDDLRTVLEKGRQATVTSIQRLQDMHDRLTNVSFFTP